MTQAQKIVDAWWYPPTELSYGQLAANLAEQKLITERMAATWNRTPNATVFVLEDLQVIEIKQVHKTDTAATVEIVAENKAFPLEYISTFLEFVDSDDGLKLDEVK